MGNTDQKPPTDDHVARGQRMRAARLAAGVPNASEFARQIGVTPNTVYRWEDGSMVPTADALKAWAVRCGVTADSLLGIRPRHHDESLPRHASAGEVR